MKLADMMDCPLKELVEQCDVVSIEPDSNVKGEIEEITIKYRPRIIEAIIPVKKPAW